MKNLQLIRARKLKGYTQQLIADMLRIQKSTVCNWENARSFPRMKEAIALTKIFDTTIEELFYDTAIIFVERENYDLPSANVIDDVKGIEFTDEEIITDLIDNDLEVNKYKGLEFNSTYVGNDNYTVTLQFEPVTDDLDAVVKFVLDKIKQSERV